MQLWTRRKCACQRLVSDWGINPFTFTIEYSPSTLTQKNIAMSRFHAVYFLQKHLLVVDVAATHDENSYSFRRASITRQTNRTELALP